MNKLFIGKKPVPTYIHKYILTEIVTDEQGNVVFLESSEVNKIEENKE